MPIGLQVFDETGALQFDTTVAARYGRIYGSLVISAAGSVTIPDLLGGTVFYFFVDYLTTAFKPGFVISGATISWTYPPGAGSQGVLFYGVY